MSDTATTTTPAAPAPDVTPQGDFDVGQLVDMIHFDPITSQPEAEATDTSEGGEEEPAEQEATTASEPSAEEPASEPDASGAQPSVSPDQTAAITAAISEGFRSAQPEPEPEQPAPGVDFSNVQVPQQIITAMEDDDPTVRLQGYQAFAAGLSTLVYQQTLQSVQQQMQTFAEAIPQYVQQQQTVTQQQQQVHDDFYGAFPQFDTPELRPTVMQVAAAVMQEQGATNWTPAIRDAVGARITAALQAVAQPASQPAPAPAKLTSQSSGSRTVPQAPSTTDPGSLYSGLMPTPM